MTKQKPRINEDKNFSHRIIISYFENPSHKFSCSLAKSIRRKFNINLAINLKTALYFQLKCNTPSTSVFNLIYKFTCLCSVNMSYIGMTSGHLVNRAQEHLHFTVIVEFA